MCAVLLLAEGSIGGRKRTVLCRKFARAPVARKSSRQSTVAAVRSSRRRRSLVPGLRRCPPAAPHSWADRRWRVSSTCVAFPSNLEAVCGHGCGARESLAGGLGKARVQRPCSTCNVLARVCSPTFSFGTQNTLHSHHRKDARAGPSTVRRSTGITPFARKYGCTLAAVRV